jgi:cyclophilin family peptidyl-prolyl cis-trans isomerase
MTKTLTLFVFFLFTLTLTACTPFSTNSKKTTNSNYNTSNQKMLTLQTNYAYIKIKLNEDKTPKTVKNFYELAKTGKYDGTIFHRVIDGFMIQGGDYENFNGTGGTSIYGKAFDDEFVSDLSNVRGAISMANAGPGTNGSQFFIVHKDATFLDGKHTVFGHVVSGMDVVDKIAKVKTGMMDAPVKKVEIIKAIAK